MYISKIAWAFLVTCLLCLIGLGVFVYLNPDGPFAYRRFQNKSRSYYSQLARACDSLLQQHPTFLKHPSSSQELRDVHALWMDTNNILWEDIKISVNDPSLPQSIRSLHPHEILLEPNRVWIGIGLRPNFAIIWGKSEIRTNTWTLVANGEGLETPLYTETR